MAEAVIISRHYTLRRAQDAANAHNLAHMKSGKREVQYSVRPFKRGLYRWCVVREPV